MAVLWFNKPCISEVTCYFAPILYIVSLILLVQRQVTTPRLSQRVVLHKFALLYILQLLSQEGLPAAALKQSACLLYAQS